MSLLEGKRFLTYVTVNLLIWFVVITIDSIYAASDSPQTDTSSTMDQSQNQCTGATPITNIQTSGSQSGFPPENVNDKNLNTLWSDYGLGSWVQLDLGTTKKICSVDIAWYKGNQRQTNFVVSTSLDGVAFTDKLTGKSSGTTLDPEKYGFPLTDTRYIKVTVNGNTQNNYASITELHVFNSTPSSLNQYLDGLPPTATTGKGLQEKYVFVKKWGSFGTGHGQFNRPHDVAFDSKGNVYVTDRDNNRVQKFTPNGTFIKAWGSKGSKDGQFSIPYSLAIDNSDNIYVADRENSRIQKFDINGNFLAKYGTDGEADGQFHRPEDVRIEPHTQDIYVTDTYNNRIERFDKNFTFITKWGSKGSADGQFNLPHAIGFDSKGNVYVDELERPGVQVFDSEGKFLRKWGSVGTDDGQFSLPQEHLWIDSKDHLYLVDGAPNPRIQIFDPTGNVLGKIGTPCKMSTGEGCIDPDGPGPLEKGDGQLSKPEHVSIDTEGNVYVVDRGNQRIQVFAPMTNESSK